MKKIITAAFLVLLPTQAIAREPLRKFRWPGGWKMPAMPALLVPPPKLLPGAGEWIAKGRQMAGPAAVEGSWKQEVYAPDGKLAYAAGALTQQPPAAASLVALEGELAEGLQRALGQLPELQTASRIFPAKLEVRKNETGEWLPAWRVEYLSPAGDRLFYLLLDRKGEVVGRGQLDWDGLDGRAVVFPQGPKLSGLAEEPLHDLVGDGTMTGRLLRVFSALDLNVWSPNLVFLFSEDDKRFDLGQVYFTVEKGFRWLKEHVGVELDHPIDLKLHVGNGGVSNAAFYHQNMIYLGTGDGVVYKDMLRDPSVLIHESIHAVIDAYVGLPSEGEGGSFNEGFADLFTALILDNPRMGEVSYLKAPFRRTLENNLKAYQDFVPGVYQNGSIIGGTFWDMRKRFGTELCAKLAFRTLVRLGRGAHLNDFPSALMSAAESLLGTEDQAFVREVALNRGWRLP